MFVLLVSAASVVGLTIDANDRAGGSLTGFGARRPYRRYCATIYAQEKLGRPLYFLYVVYVAFAVLDLTYLVLLYRVTRRHGLSPWRRV